MIIAIILVIVLIGVVCYGYYGKLTDKIENPIATIKVEGYDEPMVFELYPKEAPNTVKNFITLANNGFYNGLKFHRVEDYVIQGGDPKGDGTGGPTLSSVDSGIEKSSDNDKEYSIKGEFKANGYSNKIVHEKGVLSMARSSYTQLSSDLAEEGYNSAGSQFFVCLKYMPSFNGEYAAFGKIISGMETLDAISKVELKVDKNEETGEETKTTTPKDDVIINSITIDTKGIDYGKPDTLEPFDYYSWYLNKMYGGQN